MEYGPYKHTLGVPLVPVQTKCLNFVWGKTVATQWSSKSNDSLHWVTGHCYCHSLSQVLLQLLQGAAHLSSSIDTLYYKCGSRNLYYSDKWMDLPYFLSFQETGFEMAILKQFDTELLVSQISYKQCIQGVRTTQQRRCALQLREAVKLTYHQSMDMPWLMDRWSSVLIQARFLFLEHIINIRNWTEEDLKLHTLSMPVWS